MLIPEWLKDEDKIYNKLKDQIDDLRAAYRKHIDTKNESFIPNPYHTYYRNRYIDILAGIETDDRALKPISIVIGNWERYYYLPFIIEMYYDQDYPKDLMEIVIIDDNSSNKEYVLKLVKEQAKLYPNLKIRFIQNYINYSCTSIIRVNIGVRHSLHNIVIVADSDQLPLGKNYLRGMCYSHNNSKNIRIVSVPIAINFEMRSTDGIDGIAKTFNDTNYIDFAVIKRLDHLHLPAFNRSLFSQIHGYDETQFGWGGTEGNMIFRWALAGGKYVINTAIFEASLSNFPIPLPDGVLPGPDGKWSICSTIVANDDNWGVTKKMEEIDLYNNNPPSINICGDYSNCGDY